MVSKSPKDRVSGPLPDGPFSRLERGGDPNHVSIRPGMIPQVGDGGNCKKSPKTHLANGQLD